MTLIKAARAVGWGIGLAMLFVEPITGILILIVALAATIYLALESSNAKVGEETPDEPG